MNTSQYGARTILILTLTAAGLLEQSQAGDGGIASPIVDGLSSLVPPVAAAFGMADVTMEIHRYEYKHSSLYRNVNYSEQYVAEVNQNGKTRYNRTIQISGVDNPMTLVKDDPFIISIGGSEGEIPFSVRSHYCVMSTGNGEFFTATTNARITFKVVHRYRVNPAHMSPSTDAKITCLNWDRERSSCNEVYGTATQTFVCPIANNGTTYPSIPNGLPVNLTHRSGAGLGITW